MSVHAPGLAPAAGPSPTETPTQRLLTGLMAQADSEDLAQLAGRSAQQLGLLSGWRWAVVARFRGPEHAQLLAFVDRGRVQPGYSYPLALAPCREVQAAAGVHHVQALRQRYAHERALLEMGVQQYAGLVYRSAGLAIGHVFLMHDRALAPAQARQVDPLLQLAALHIGSRMELAEQRQRLRDWQDLAETDALTQLPNRRAFEHELGLQLALHAQRARPDSLLAIVDVNGLKKVNDGLGHAEGDRLLRQVAAGLQAALRPGRDQLFRLGGDEFALLTDAPGSGCAVLLQARVQACGSALPAAGFAEAGLSLGFARLAEVRGERSAWLALADARMYTAKRQAQAARS